MTSTHSTSAILLATTTSEFLTYPLEVIKTRTQIKAPASSTISIPQSSLKRLWNFTRDNGLKTLYKGFSPSLMRGVQIQSIRFGFYDKMDKRLQHYFATDSSLSIKSISLKTCSALISSAFAGFISNPWIVLKIRMIADNSGQYSTLTKSIRTVISQNGYREFFKGTGLSMIRGTVLSTAELVTYDSLKTALKTKEGFDAKACFIASVLSSFAGAFVSYPFDVLRTVHVSDNSQELRNQRSYIFAKLREICKQKGGRGLYAGFFVYLSRALVYGPLFWNSLEIFNHLGTVAFDNLNR